MNALANKTKPYGVVDPTGALGVAGRKPAVKSYSSCGMNNPGDEPREKALDVKTDFQYEEHYAKRIKYGTKDIEV